MKSLLLMLSVFIAGILSSHLNAAGIEVSEHTWNLGAIPKNAYAAHVFVIKNTNSFPVKVLRMRRFCSCLIIALSDTILYPDVPVRFKVGYFSGQKSTNEQNKIYLTTDDPRKEILKFTIRAWVGKDLPGLRVQPNRLKVEQLKQTGFWIYNDADTVARFKLVYATPGISVQPESTVINNRDSVLVACRSKYKAFDEPPSILVEIDTVRVTIPIDTK